MATTAEEVEQILIADWHEDQCGCLEFRDTGMCWYQEHPEAGIRMTPPITWSVEDVLDAFDQVMASRAVGE